MESFYNKDDPENSIFKDDKAYLWYYQVQNIIGAFLSLVILGVFGQFADKLDFRIIWPITLLIRAGCYFMAYTINDPTHWPFFIIVPLLHTSFHVTIVVVDGFIQKMYPKEIRAMLNSMYGVTE